MINDKAPMNEILTTVELAAALGRHRTYISAMKKAGYHGFSYNQHHLETAIKWLAAHPKWSSVQSYPTKWGRRKPQIQKQTLASKMLAINTELLRKYSGNK